MNNTFSSKKRIKTPKIMATINFYHLPHITQTHLNKDKDEQFKSQFTQIVKSNKTPPSPPRGVERWLALIRQSWKSPAHPRP